MRFILACGQLRNGQTGQYRSSSGWIQGYLAWRTLHQEFAVVPDLNAGVYRGIRRRGRICNRVEPDFSFRLLELYLRQFGHDFTAMRLERIRDVGRSADRVNSSCDGNIAHRKAGGVTHHQRSSLHTGLHTLPVNRRSLQSVVPWSELEGGRKATNPTLQLG